MESLFERIERLRKNETCKKVNKRQKIIANRTMMYEKKFCARLTTKQIFTRPVDRKLRVRPTWESMR